MQIDGGYEPAFSDPAETYVGLGLDRDTARACMVADVLAWAVSHGIPLPDALMTLPFIKRPFMPGPRGRSVVAFLRDACVPFRPWFWLMNVRWAWNVKLVIQDIEKGEPLSAALERNLRRHFPGFYLMGIAKAEAERHLDTALPVLARQLNFPATVASERKQAVLFLGWRVFFALYVLLFITVTLVPRLAAVFTELMGTPPPLTGPAAIVASNLLTASAFVIIVLFILGRMDGIGESIVLHLPIVGQERRRFILGDLARSMAVFMRQGEDILSAAEWSLKATRSLWLRQRLEVFTAALRGGDNWVDAWDRMKLGTPLDQWIVANAAARQDPASGFELLAEWLHQGVMLTTRRLERWLDPFFTLATALLVGSTAYYVFSMLTKVLWHLV